MRRKQRGRGPARGARATGPAERRASLPGGQVALWGWHAVAAALGNPARRVSRLFCGSNATSSIAEILAGLPPDRRAVLPEPEPLDRAASEAFLPDGAVDQGVVLLAAPLTAPEVENLAASRPGGSAELVVVLDQVTDPHNVGAILRSAAAFGAGALILQTRHAPPADGVLAKAASGALDRVPLVEVTNISRALETLQAQGFWCVGLAGDAPDALADARFDGATALVLGAEGPGLRRLTRETCDQLVHLPTETDFATLNVSNAAAVALYEVRMRRG